MFIILKFFTLSKMSLASVQVNYHEQYYICIKSDFLVL